MSYPGTSLAWREEFSGDALDEAVWSQTSGTGSRGDGERQYHHPGNTIVRGGYLVITARREDHEGSRFTSSRIVTRGGRLFRHGRIDIRALMPRGQGIRPVLGLVGASPGQAGEIDIMEMIGGQARENTVHGTLRWNEDGQRRYEGGSLSLPSGTFADQFHVFSVIRDASSIRWLVDGYTYFEWDIGSPAFAALREPFHVSVSLAVGGAWPGDPSPETGFPQHLVVDYVRVFEPLP